MLDMKRRDFSSLAGFASFLHAAPASIGIEAKVIDSDDWDIEERTDPHRLPAVDSEDQ